MEDGEAKDLTEASYSMRQRYRESGQMSEIDGAISRLRRSLDLRLPPHPMRVVSLLSLASALHDRNLQAPCIEDSDGCISLFREALLSRSAGLLDELDDVITFEPALHRDLDSITDFASALAYRFNLTGQHMDLRNSISLGKALLEHCPTYPELFSVHMAVGTAFFQQHRITGQTNDLSEAKKHYQEALPLIPSDHKMRSTVSASIADVLVLEYLDLGQSSDKLDEALPILRQHLANPYTPPGGRHISLDSLARALLMKYESTGKQEYVDEAIGFYNEAFKILPVSHPNRSTLLGNLAVAFSLRYEQTRQSYHLEQAIAFNRQALESMPTSHPQRFGHLLNLAICLTNRSKRISSLQDIQDSIAFLEEALQLCPASHLFALLNLGVALCHHFRQTREIQSLDRAIACYKEVQRDMHRNSPVRHRLCTGLASALIDRFEATHQCPDLEEAITVFREGLSLIPPHHPGRCMSGILAGGFVRLYSVTKDQKHLEDAVSAYRDVAKNYSCFLSSRLLHASDWARIATAQNHPSALEAYQEAINLAPMLVALGMNMKTRQEPLLMLGDLPRNAARVAICERRPEVAIELLEEGRGVFWSQALRLRTPFDELRLKAPALAETLTMVSEKLEKGSFRDGPEFAHGKVERAMSLEQQEALYRSLEDQWHQALDEARKLDGLENLLRPKPFGALQSAAANGPVVILNASDNECDGLILTLDGVKHIPFPNTSTELLCSLIRLLRLAISQQGGRTDIPESIQTDLLTHRHGGMCVAPGHTSDDRFRFVLQRLWEDVAHPVIQALRLQV
jgi:tetratricopeptide (TPR) repeat protein